MKKVIDSLYKKNSAKPATTKVGADSIFHDKESDYEKYLQDTLKWQQEQSSQSSVYYNQVESYQHLTQGIFLSMNNTLQHIANIISGKKGSKPGINEDLAKQFSGLKGKAHNLDLSHPDGHTGTAGEEGALKDLGGTLHDNMIDAIVKSLSPTRRYKKGTDGLDKDRVAVVGKGETIIDAETSGQLRNLVSGLHKKLVSGGSLDDVDKSSFNNLLQGKNLSKGSLDNVISGIDGISDKAKAQYTKLSHVFSNSGVDINDKKESIFGQVKDVLLQGAEIGSESLFGKSVKENKALGDKFLNTQIMGDVKKFAPEIGASGAIGAVGLPLLTAGILGPLGGLAVGAGIGLLKRSQSAQKAIFGEVGEDGKSHGGLLGGKTLDKIKGALPDMKRLGIVGGLAGIMPFVPFVGPVGGIMLGAATGYAKNSETFMTSLFGEGYKDKKKKMLENSFITKLKKSAPQMIAGAGLATFLGPFGLLGNAAMGAGLGLASTSTKFREMIIGKYNKNTKKYENGLLPSLREKVVNPMADAFKELTTNFSTFFKDEIMKPVRDAMKPILLMTKDIGKKGLFGMFKLVDKLSGKIFGKSISQMVKDKIANSKIVKGVKAIGRGIKKGAKSVITAPSRAIGWAGKRAQAYNIRNGVVDPSTTAAERLEFAQDNDVRSFWGRVTGKDADYKARTQDEFLRDLSPEQLNEFGDNLNSYYESDEARQKKLKEIGTNARSTIFKNKTFGSMSAKAKNNMIKSFGKGDINATMQAAGYSTEEYDKNSILGNVMTKYKESNEAKKSANATALKQLEASIKGDDKDTLALKKTLQEIIKSGGTIDDDTMHQLKTFHGEKASGKVIDAINTNRKAMTKSKNPAKAALEEAKKTYGNIISPEAMSAYEKALESGDENKAAVYLSAITQNVNSRALSTESIKHLGKYKSDVDDMKAKKEDLRQVLKDAGVKDKHLIDNIIDNHSRGDSTFANDIINDQFKKGRLSAEGVKSINGYMSENAFDAKKDYFGTKEDKKRLIKEVKSMKGLSDAQKAKAKTYIEKGDIEKFSNLVNIDSTGTLDNRISDLDELYAQYDEYSKYLEGSANYEKGRSAHNNIMRELGIKPGTYEEARFKDQFKNELSARGSKPVDVEGDKDTKSAPKIETEEEKMVNLQTELKDVNTNGFTQLISAVNSLAETMKSLDLHGGHATAYSEAHVRNAWNVGDTKGKQKAKAQQKKLDKQAVKDSNSEFEDADKKATNDFKKVKKGKHRRRKNRKKYRKQNQEAARLQLLQNEKEAKNDIIDKVVNNTPEENEDLLNDTITHNAEGGIVEEPTISTLSEGEVVLSPSQVDQLMAILEGKKPGKLSRIKNGAKGIANKVGNSKAVKTAKNIGNNILHPIQFMKKQMSSLFSTITAPFKKIGGAIKSFGGYLKDKFSNWRKERKKQKPIKKIAKTLNQILGLLSVKFGYGVHGIALIKKSDKSNDATGLNSIQSLATKLPKNPLAANHANSAPRMLEHGDDPDTTKVENTPNGIIKYQKNGKGDWEPDKSDSATLETLKKEKANMSFKDKVLSDLGILDKKKGGKEVIEEGGKKKEGFLSKILGGLTGGGLLSKLVMGGGLLLLAPMLIKLLGPLLKKLLPAIVKSIPKLVKGGLHVGGDLVTDGMEMINGEDKKETKERQAGAVGRLVVRGPGIFKNLGKKKADRILGTSMREARAGKAAADATAEAAAKGATKEGIELAGKEAAEKAMKIGVKDGLGIAGRIARNPIGAAFTGIKRGLVKVAELPHKGIVKVLESNPVKKAISGGVDFVKDMGGKAIGKSADFLKNTGTAIFEKAGSIGKSIGARLFKSGSEGAKAMGTVATDLTGKAGMLDTLMKSIESFLKGLFNNSIVRKLIGEDAAEKLAKKALPELLKALARGAASAAPEVITKAVGAIGTGGLLNVGFAVYDFVSGYNDAKNILSITSEPSFGMKVTAGLVKAFTGFCTFGIISAETIVNIFMNYILPIFDKKEGTLEKDRAQAQKTVEQYNKTHGTNYNVQQYNKKTDPGFFTKIGNTVAKWGGKVGSTLGKWWTTGKNKVSEGIDWAANKVDQGVGWVKQKASQAGNWISNKWNSFWGGSGEGVVHHPYQPKSVMSQYNPLYKSTKFAGSNLAKKGCGPVAAATAINAMSGGRGVANPVDAAKFAEQNGFVNKQGTDENFFDSYANNYGYGFERSNNPAYVKQALANNNPVVLGGQGNMFGKNSHYLVANGTDGKMVSVTDPRDGQNYVYPYNDVIKNSQTALIGRNLGSDYASDPTMANVFTGMGTPDAVEQKGQASSNLVYFMKQMEGFSSKVYDDSGGVPTVGYGSTSKADLAKAPVTEAVATQMLVNEMDSKAKGVDGLLIKTGLDNLNQGQFDALVDFAYNCGLGGLEKSSMWQAVKGGKTGSALEAVWSNSYVHDERGNRLAGLVKRRTYEYDMWAGQGKIPGYNTPPQITVLGTGKYLTDDNGYGAKPQAPDNPGAGSFGNAGSNGSSSSDGSSGGNGIMSFFSDLSSVYEKAMNAVLGISTGSTDGSSDGSGSGSSSGGGGDSSNAAVKFFESTIPGSKETSTVQAARKINGVTRPHWGIDIAAPMGSTIKSPIDGKVQQVGFDKNGFGNFLVLKDEDGYENWFGHLQHQPNLKAGQSVKVDQDIAKMGSTGRSTGPHLHYEIRKDGNKYYPNSYLSQYQQYEQGKPANSPPINPEKIVLGQQSSSGSNNSQGGGRSFVANDVDGTVFQQMLGALLKIAINTDKINDIIKILVSDGGASIGKDKIDQISKVAQMNSASQRALDSVNNALDMDQDQQTQYIFNALAAIANE